MKKNILKRVKRLIATVFVSCLCLSLGGCAQLIGSVVSSMNETEEESFIEDDFDLIENEWDSYEPETEDTEEIESEIVKKEFVDYDVDLSENLMDFEFSIEGDIYKIPMFFSDFESLGWTYNDDRYKELASYEYIILAEWEKDGIVATTNIANLSLNSACVEDCLITEITLNPYKVAETNASVEFPCDILIGKSTKEDIIAAYGEPASIVDRSMEEQLVYEYPDSYDQSINFIVNTETGLLSDFIIENFVEIEGVNNEVSTEVPEDILNYNAPTELGDDLYNISFKLEEQVYELPCPMALFLENGFEIGRDYTETVIPAGRTELIYLRFDNRDIQVRVENTSKKATTPENCWVTYFEAYAYYNELKLDIVLPEGLKRGMTRDEVMAIIADKYNTEPLYDESDDIYIYEDRDEMYDRNIVVQFTDDVVVGFEFETYID